MSYSDANDYFEGGAMGFDRSSHLVDDGYEDEDNLTDLEIKDKVEIYHMMDQAGLLIFHHPAAKTMLDKLHHYYTAPKCPDCKHPQPGHAYACIHAKKCSSCRARIDMPPVEHYAHCQGHQEPRRQQQNQRQHSGQRQDQRRQHTQHQNQQPQRQNQQPQKPKQKVPDLTADFPALTRN